MLNVDYTTNPKDSAGLIALVIENNRMFANKLEENIKVNDIHIKDICKPSTLKRNSILPLVFLHRALFEDIKYFIV